MMHTCTYALKWVRKGLRSERVTRIFAQTCVVSIDVHVHVYVCMLCVNVCDVHSATRSLPNGLHVQYTLLDAQFTSAPTQPAIAVKQDNIHTCTCPPGN